jgi:glutathione S-transferase
MTMRLHWHPFSIFPRRIRIALREKGIPCDEVLVDLPGGATRSPEFRRLNPFGQVPVLEDGDLVLYESIAILEYLEETHPSPPLLPRDAVDRAHARQLMLTSGDHLAPAFKRWVMRFFTPETAWDRDDQARAVEEIGAHLDVLESVLGDREYLVGAFSLADVCYAPFTCELEQVALGHLLVGRPRVRAWVDRLNARPSLPATRPALPS